MMSENKNVTLNVFSDFLKKRFVDEEAYIVLFLSLDQQCVATTKNDSLFEPK